MSDNVEVKIGGDYGEATDGAKDAASSIASSLDGIKTALQNFSSKNKEVAEQAIKNNANISRSFIELKGSATSGFNAIAGVIERFRGVLGSLTGALAGGMIGKEAISSLTSLRDEVHGLQVEFGMTADKATLLSVQLKLAGVSSETYEQMGQRVGRILKTQGEEFDRLGVKTKDAAGNLLPLDTILQNTYQRMLDFKPGTDQLEFALSTVGRNAKDFATDMEQLNSVSQRAIDMQQKLGIEMGPARQAEVARYKVEFNAFKLTLDEVGVKIGEQLLPGLQKLGEWFNSTGPSAVSAIVPIIKGFITATDLAADSVSLLWQALTTLLRIMTDVAVGIVNVSVRLAHLDFSGAATAAQTAWEQMKSDTKNAADSMVKTTQDAVTRISNLWSGVSGQYGMGDRGVGQSGALPGKGTARFTPKPAGGGSDERLAQFKSELDDMNLANGAFLQLSKQNEVEFWEEKLALVKGYGKQDVTLRQEINREILRASNAAAKEDLAADVAALHEKETEDKKNRDAQIADAVALSSLMKQIYGENSAEFKNALKEETAIREQWTAKEEELAKRLADIKMRSDEQTAKYNIEMNKMADDQAVAMGQMSNAQRIAQERSFVQQEYQIDLDGINARLAAEKEGTAEYAKLMAEKLTMEQNFQKQLTALSNAAELERTQDARAAAQDIQNSLGTLIDNLVSRTQSLSKSWQDFVKQLSGSMTSLASNAFMKQIMGPGTAGGDFLGKLTGGVFGGGSASAATTANTTAVGSLTMAVEANTAALGGSAVGAAGGVAGGSFGGIFGDLIPSFDVGSPYIPQDTLAVVHKGEKIIPAKYNNGGASFGVRNQFMINGPIDTRTMQQISHASEKAQRKASIRLNK